MSWDCKYKVGKLCNRRENTCVPGGKGCVLRGKFYFPFKDEDETESNSVSEKKKKGPKSS